MPWTFWRACNPIVWRYVNYCSSCSSGRSLSQLLSPYCSKVLTVTGEVGIVSPPSGKLFTALYVLLFIFVEQSEAVDASSVVASRASSNAFCLLYRLRINCERHNWMVTRHIFLYKLQYFRNKRMKSMFNKNQWICFCSLVSAAFAYCLTTASASTTSGSNTSDIEH